MKAGLAYYKKIFGEIDKGDIGCLYLLKGSESFIMEEMVGRISGSNVAEEMKSFNMTLMYGTEADIGSFIATANSFPFLSEKRVLVLKEMEKLRSGWKKLVEYCSNPVPTSVVILLLNTHDETGRRIKPPRDFRRLESIVQEKGRVIQFDKLKERDLHRWIQQKARRMGVEIPIEVAESLVRSVGGNLYEIQNDLGKLAILYENERVGNDDLEKVIGSYRMNAIYDLLDGIRPGNEPRVLDILTRIINTGAEKPSVVIYYLIRHFLSLLKIKAGCRIGGFQNDRLRKKAGLFSTRGIVLWLENLRQVDIWIKSTSFPVEALLVGAFLHSMRGELLEDNPDAFPAA